MTTKTQLLRAIRQHCLACCSGSFADVELCQGSEFCAIHPYRFGTDPDEPSEAMKEKGRRIAELRKAQLSAGSGST